jgi:hypothetical protein
MGRRLERLQYNWLLRHHRRTNARADTQANACADGSANGGADASADDASADAVTVYVWRERATTTTMDATYRLVFVAAPVSRALYGDDDDEKETVWSHEFTAIAIWWTLPIVLALLCSWTGACSPPSAGCCPADPFVFVGSPYASAAPTACNTYDYNCDGLVSLLPCCAHLVPLAIDGARTLYNASACAATNGGVPLSNASNDVCGACTGTDVVPGWACSEAIASRRKRIMLPCPSDACTFVDTTPTTPPALGECALFTDHCVPPHGGDGERCCLVAAA